MYLNQFATWTSSPRPTPEKAFVTSARFLGFTSILPLMPQGLHSEKFKEYILHDDGDLAYLSAAMESTEVS